MLPSPATHLFNHPITCIMPIINRPLIGLNIIGKHYEALVRGKMKNDTPRKYTSIPVGSTGMVQCEDSEPWIHGTMEGKGDNNHNDRSYTI